MSKINKHILLISSLLLLSACSNDLNAQQNKTAKAETSSEKTVGNKYKLPTVVFYFADWCPYCKQTFPVINKAGETFKDKVYFHTIDIDTEYGKKFSKTYRPKPGGIPYTQFFDAKGKYLSDRVGAMNYQTLEALIKKNFNI